jgi:hypothetical protein
MFNTGRAHVSKCLRRPIEQGNESLTVALYCLPTRWGKHWDRTWQDRRSQETGGLAHRVDRLSILRAKPYAGAITLDAISQEFVKLTRLDDF